MEEVGKTKSFQVVDKRRFDAAGKERSIEEQAQQEVEVASESPRTPTNDGSEAASSQQQESSMRRDNSTEFDEPVAFTSFIMSLATQVLVQLGEMPPPSGMEIPRDLDSARQTIDILTMLQQRTRGNLSNEESRFFEEVLHSLRMSFINAKKKGD